MKAVGTIASQENALKGKDYAQNLHFYFSHNVQQSFEI